ncbi:MAG: IS630 family transposase [Actinobacteria bacterium]|nr:IS630 family transposase [Actinomycetota bacterium]
MATNRAVEIELSDEERVQLEAWARRPTSAQALAQRSRIVLAAADGVKNTEIAQRLGVGRPMVTKWRNRFSEHRLDGLLDEPRPGQPRTISDAQVEEVITKTLESTPKDATHWSTRSMAAEVGLTQSAVHRIWKAFGLQPHRQDTWKLSKDPQFVAKVKDVVGLYLDPPERAVVLCVDEKSQIQALDRTAPILPMLPGVPERATHDYKRHGTSSLYAALDITTGQVIGRLHARHRAIEFKKFLQTIDREVPAELDVHLVIDNASTHKTPAVKKWLLAHPRFVVHFTPTSSSWLNLVERWFSELTTKKLRRATHRSVRQLNSDIRAWVDTWNNDPKPFVWTKTADQILESIATYCNRINDSRH